MSYLRPFRAVYNCWYRFAEPLKMHNFPLSEELDGIPDIGIIGKAQDIVISCACLLLCCRP